MALSTLLLLGMGLSAVSGLAQSPQTTFRSASNLVLVDVMALKNGLPDKTLTKDDFQVLDDGRPVSIETFDTGSRTRPLALWFLVQCSMQGWEKNGSGLFQGQIRRFEPTLAGLNREDTVGVAHWCDNGDSKLDLLPTRDVDAAAATLEQALAPVPDGQPSDRPGELALERTLQLIIDATRPLAPERVPVVIFLYGDHSGMPRSEADRLIDELLETSATAYGLKDRRSPMMWFPLFDEQKEIAHYIATETGGQYFPVTPETYAAGLEEILRQLHFRYELGFKPEALDGKRHKLRVELTGAGNRQHKGARLRHRAAYVAVRHDGEGFASGALSTRIVGNH